MEIVTEQENCFIIPDTNILYHQVLFSIAMHSTTVLLAMQCTVPFTTYQNHFYYHYQPNPNFNSLSSLLQPVTLTLTLTHPNQTNHKTKQNNSKKQYLTEQVDLLEHNQVDNVIILQTVLEELKHRSTPVYQRIRALISNSNIAQPSTTGPTEAVPKRKFYVFSNEHHRDTYITKQIDESPNDRNDRAIRRAQEWYISHLSPLKVKIILISDDKENRFKANQEGLTAISVREYAESRTDCLELMDLVSERVEEGGKVLYDEHLTPTQISAGLKSGAFHQGVLAISTHNYLEATTIITINHVEQTLAIIGRSNLNRATQGDVIAIQILPKSEWLVSQISEEPDSELLESTSKETLQQSTTPSAKVIGIIKRNWRPLCGSIDPKNIPVPPTTTLQSLIFRPIDIRFPKIRIRSRQTPYLLNTRIIVTLDSWPRDSHFPHGHFVRCLGASGTRETETEMLLLEHDVPFMPFSTQVLSYLPTQGHAWTVDDVSLEGREDFRGLDVCSIDPPGCTDIDDALHVRSVEGGYEVGVHIADVGHFVRPGNAMDREALRRGTTVYLVDKRIDMVPSMLGSDLCSLKSDVDRLSFSVIWVFKDGEVVSSRVCKSVIRSKASLTYDEAQMRIDDLGMEDGVSKGIRVLNGLAKMLRKKRIENGALTLASPEVRFKIEGEGVDVEMKMMKEANALVEEFMLLANIYVAKKINEVFPESALLRRHPRPPPNNFVRLVDAVAQQGLTVDPTTSLSLAKSLDAAVTSDPYFNTLVRIMTTRCMMQAVYFCSGTVAEPEFWHYGLASPIYTHFTSPIRRYADLQVHRLLAVCVGFENGTPELTDKVRVKEMSDGILFN